MNASSRRMLLDSMFLSCMLPSRMPPSRMRPSGLSPFGTLRSGTSRSGLPAPRRSLSTARALATCLAAALALTACASTESARRTTPEPAPVANDGDVPRIVTDVAYTAYVERQAASRGISVHWVNKRQKRLPPGQATPDAE